MGELKRFGEYLEINANALLEYYADKKIDTSLIHEMVAEIKEADTPFKMEAIAERLDYTIGIAMNVNGYKPKNTINK